LQRSFQEYGNNDVIFPVHVFIILDTVNNKYLFNTNNEIHKYRTRYNNNLHLQIANLSKFNKGAYISGAKVFNHLPQYIKSLANDTQHGSLMRIHAINLDFTNEIHLQIVKPYLLNGFFLLFKK
jgi:hypothetical protein